MPRYGEIPGPPLHIMMADYGRERDGRLIRVVYTRRKDGAKSGKLLMKVALSDDLMEDFTENCLAPWARRQGCWLRVIKKKEG